ncbi:MAG: hypothetical protein Q8N34_03375 [Gammaproteobacteria bacterium]|nr:hypothetical protein [Gammaproteobacteria bacterium]
MAKKESAPKSKVLTGHDFCKSFRVDGHQVVFVLLDDEQGVPILHLLCEIHGERVKSAYRPELDGKPLLLPQERNDFAISSLNAVTKKMAIEMYSFVQRQWEEANGKPSAPVDVSTILRGGKK